MLAMKLARWKSGGDGGEGDVGQIRATEGDEMHRERGGEWEGGKGGGKRTRDEEFDDSSCKSQLKEFTGSKPSKMFDKGINSHEI